MSRTEMQDLDEQDEAALDAEVTQILANLLGPAPEGDRKKIADAAERSPSEQFAATIRKVCGF